MYSLADFRIQTTSYFSIALTFVCIVMEMWGFWTTFLCFCVPSIFCAGTALYGGILLPSLVRYQILLWSCQIFMLTCHLFIC